MGDKTTERTKPLWIMNMFIVLMVVISQVCTYVTMYQNMHLKFAIYHMSIYLNKAINFFNGEKFGILT